MNEILLQLNGMRAANNMSMCSGYTTTAYPRTRDMDLATLWNRFTAFDYSVEDKLTDIRESEL